MLFNPLTCNSVTKDFLLNDHDVASTPLRQFKQKNNIISLISLVIVNLPKSFFLSLDYSASQWRLQVELLVDAVQETNSQVTLSLPELDSELTFQTRFLPGKTRTSFVLNVNKVYDTVILCSCVLSLCSSLSAETFFLLPPESLGEAVVAQRTR